MTTAEVDDYLSAVAEPARTTLTVVRERLRALLPQATESIAYAVPAFRIDGVAVAGYGAGKKHCAYYPMSGSVLAGLADELGDYRMTKGSLQFPLDEALPEALLALLVEARLAEIGGQQK